MIVCMYRVCSCRLESMNGDRMYVYDGMYVYILIYISSEMCGFFVTHPVLYSVWYCVLCSV